jgi:ATP synthase I subunit
MTEEPTPWYDRESPQDALRRIKRTALVAAAVFAVFMAFSAGFQGVLGLTCSAAVTMISFLWLEEIVDALLQPAAHLHARRLTLRTLARFALLGVALTVTIIIARFNALSVLLGFSIIVVGICGEALYSLYREVARR